MRILGFAYIFVKCFFFLGTFSFPLHLDYKLCIFKVYCNSFSFKSRKSICVSNDPFIYHEL
jgi:hypothetical protein